MPTTLLLAHPDLKTQRQLCVKKREASAAPFDPFAMMVQKYISENDFNALCNITKQLQIILTESKEEEDQKIFEINLEKLKEATHHLENFHCQVPVITTLVTEIPDATLENEEVTEIVTNPTQIEDRTEPGSLCDDCEVEVEYPTLRWSKDENGEEYAQVVVVDPSCFSHYAILIEDTASYQPIVNALFTVLGIFGIALLGTA